jgi:glycosyltransferase involved in cell wall biosynthesis
MAQKIATFLSRYTDLIFVNSQGCKKDVQKIVNDNKIIVLEHWADDVFFDKADSVKLRESFGLKDKFVILFVGRVDREKHCNVLMDISNRLKEEKDFYFIFIGVGELANQLKNLEKTNNNIRYLNYIGSKEELSKYYKAADLLWSYADETYLAKPAVESLASGTPILIPDVPALIKKAKEKIRINTSLVPKEIGWIVDKENLDEIIKLIIGLKENRLILKKMKNNCYKFALERHSKKNIEFAIKMLSQ